jgi:hypothetical protein
VEGWIEFKLTHAWKVHVTPQQIGWMERRTRAGGRCFIGVRRQTLPGPRRGAAADEFYLYRGSAVRILSNGALTDARRLGQWSDGPAAWDWAEIAHFLLRSPITD